MVDQRILQRKIVQINESIQMIAGYAHLGYEQFITDKVVQNVVEYNLFIIINQMAEIANHIVVDNGYGTIEMLSDGFRILKQKGYISDSEAATYIKMVGFRNIIAHQYTSLDKKIVYDVMKNKLDDIKKFLVMLHDNFM
ncbi:type VII toxin-antitoxin system HepT family RNase toxin [Petroclostridium xylanilyticum]|jgi:uncharacterized protein YutE (UPF0331/DUF86 family)|uniref:type VII toxin-antitoxin system HepT family RNase toxin n=1 Tax=Petroclostridium xylanilyticum TaxID=1792311 RepID=UPI000B99C338|nr:DUF86 domain-containing protein [Petroclostridium xylanilyticum]